MTAALGRVAVLGGGLIGGSIAAAARAAGGVHVVLTDRDGTARRVAAERGLADEVVDRVEDAARDADLVVVAVPPEAVPEVVVDASSVAPDRAILTDVGSVKSNLTLDVESRLRAIGGDPGRFVGGHPMAGSERHGPGAATGTLFQGATWILTPTEATRSDALTVVSRFVGRLGANVLVLRPDEHDRLVAVASHLPHAVASTLAQVAADTVERTGDAVLAVAAGGFRDTTRIAAADPDLWVGILRGNRDAVLTALRAYGDRLEGLTSAIAEDRWDDVAAGLERAAVARRRLAPKERVTRWVDLVIALDDEPGALALAATALGTAGVNVEDLAMRHATARRGGALVVRIAADAIDAANTALAQAGLAARVEVTEDVAGDRPSS